MIGKDIIKDLLFARRELSKTSNAAISIVVRDDFTFLLAVALFLHHLGDDHCDHRSQHHHHHHRRRRCHRSNHHRVIIINTVSWRADTVSSLQS